VVIGHAGDPAHWSFKILEHARASAAWRVHEVPGPLPWLSKESLAEQQALLLPSEYARRHLNKWVEAEDRLGAVDDLRACVGEGDPILEPVRRERYVVGVDLGVKHDRTVGAVCHLNGGDVVLDRMQVWSPARDRPVNLDDVEAWVLEAHTVYNRATVVFDTWQALSMTQRLRAKRVRIVEFAFSQASVGRLATTLYRLVRDRRLDLPDDAELLDELANVRLREPSPGVFRMDHDRDRHDDRAIALALAATQLLEVPPPRRLRFPGAHRQDAPESFIGEHAMRAFLGGS
jgi:phage terminase large subunit-like protein